MDGFRRMGTTGESCPFCHMASIFRRITPCIRPTRTALVGQERTPWRVERRAESGGGKLKQNDDAFG